MESLNTSSGDFEVFFLISVGVLEATLLFGTFIALFIGETLLPRFECNTGVPWSSFIVVGGIARSVHGSPINFSLAQKFHLQNKNSSCREADRSMAGTRPSKATKKFQSKHLTRVLENRKIQKKNKSKFNKPKAQNDAPKTIGRTTDQEEGTTKKASGSGKGSLFDEMTIDEFLETGGGDVTTEIVTKPGEDELEKSHKAGLESLKERDPSFYEFLKQNDRKLLDFDPDELLEDEEEAEDVPIEGGLTTEILSRWEKLMVEERSLGALKKVLIAVRNAATNVTGEEPQSGNAKYILTNPESTLLL